MDEQIANIEVKDAQREVRKRWRNGEASSNGYANEPAKFQRPANLREASKGHKPNRYKDFVAFATHVRGLDKAGKLIRVSAVHIPHNDRDTGSPKYADLW